MPNEIQAISPTVDHLMRMIEQLQCVPGKEFEIELAIREALGNAVIHGNEERPEKKVHIRCRCAPDKGISIVVTDEGKGFDFEKAVDQGIASAPAVAHGHGIQLMKAYMDDVRFARGGTEVRMWKAPTRRARMGCDPKAK